MQAPASQRSTPAQLGLQVAGMADVVAAAEGAGGGGDGVAVALGVAFVGDSDEQPSISRTTGSIPCRRGGTRRSKPSRLEWGNFLRVQDATATTAGLARARSFFFFFTKT